MATKIASKPVFMQKVLTNGTDFIGLYFRSEKNLDNSEIVDKFYWLQSNSSGAYLTGRDNALNGYFTSQSAAELGVPSGYEELEAIEDWKSKYRIGYLNMFPFDEGNLVGYPTAADRVKSEYAEMAAVGMNDAVLTIEWDSIFATYSEQTTNDNSKWAKHDDLIDYFKSLTTVEGNPMGVSLRIKVAKDDSTHYDLEDPDNNNGWYGLRNSAKDQLGYVIRVGRGFGHVSLAYSTGVAQVLDFVEKTIERYKDKLGSQFNWCSVVFSAQDEDGYNYENQHYIGDPASAFYASAVNDTYTNANLQAWASAKYGGNISALNAYWGTSYGSFSEITIPPSGTDNKGKDKDEWMGGITNPYPAAFDYSSHSITGFKDWLASTGKYNGSISALNTVWGTSYANFAAVVTPGTGLSGSHETLNSIYTTNAGKDWYEWNLKLINDFLVACETIAEANGVRFTTETGSDVDILSPRRHTIDISRFVNIGTMHKSQLGAITRNPSFAMSVDLLRENYAEQGGYLGTEINTNDFIEQLGITDPFEMQQVMQEMITSCVLDAKAKYIMFISRKESGYFNVAKTVASSTRTLMQSPNFRIPAVVPSFTYTIYQILNNGIDWLRQQWAAAGGSVNNRVKAIQSSSNTITPPTGCVFPYQIYSIQQFCLSSGGIRTSAYGYTYDAVKFTHALWSCATHSISYVTGQPSICDYTITGNTDGVVYVKNTQNKSYIADGGDMNNNHPRYADNPAYVNDSVFVLPINQSYTVAFTAKSSNAFSATVEYMDVNPSHDTILAFRRKMSTGGTVTASFSFDPSTLGTNFIRQIKINCNRTTETDSASNVG